MAAKAGTNKVPHAHAFYFKKYNHLKAGKFRLSFKLIGDGADRVEEMVFQYQITHGTPAKLIIKKIEPVDSANQLPKRKKEKFFMVPEDGAFRKECYQIGKQFYAVLQFTDKHGNYCCTGRKCCMGRTEHWTIEVSLGFFLGPFFLALHSPRLPRSHNSTLKPVRSSHKMSGHYCDCGAFSDVRIGHTHRAFIARTRLHLVHRPLCNRTSH